MRNLNNLRSFSAKAQRIVNKYYTNFAGLNYDEAEELRIAMGGEVDPTEEIREWLDKYNIKNYTINDDLTIDVNGDVNLNNEESTKLAKLPEYIKFNVVKR